MLQHCSVALQEPNECQTLEYAGLRHRPKGHRDPAQPARQRRPRKVPPRQPAIAPAKANHALAPASSPPWQMEAEAQVRTELGVLPGSFLRAARMSLRIGRFPSCPKERS